MKALSLAEDNRILSACKVLPIGYVNEDGYPTDDEKNGIPVYDIVDGKYHGLPIVDSLPNGDITDYLYENGGYIHDPVLRPEPDPIPGEDLTADEMAAAIMEGVNEI